MMLAKTMRAMVTMGQGDLDQMVLHEAWPRLAPAPDEVLIRVRACGLNNTDVNTRSGWYSKTVTDATTGGAFEEVGEDDPTWGGAPITFPRIQGADVDPLRNALAVQPDLSDAELATFSRSYFTAEGMLTRAWVDATYPLEQMREAQAAFIAKKHTGNIVVTP
ncbi:MAG: hypothetical protein WBC85_12315 [Planktotalea sp.]|uniref:hypothetical protein n=1 Tax=Planktotalea sp. TaxID=2029877 RepID=UPI003C78D7C1